MERNYSKEVSKDLNLLVNQLAVFCKLDNKFYKLAVLDHRSLRFELWGDTLTRWVSFKDGILFNYYDKETFDELYDYYVKNNSKAKTKEKLISWFEEYEGRITFVEGYEEYALQKKEEKKKLDEAYIKSAEENKKKKK